MGTAAVAPNTPTATVAITDEGWSAIAPAGTLTSAEEDVEDRDTDPSQTNLARGTAALNDAVRSEAKRATDQTISGRALLALFAAAFLFASLIAGFASGRPQRAWK